MKTNVQRICEQCIACRNAQSRVQLHGLCTPLPMPTKDWVDISMDFVLGLPKSKKGRNLIFVVVDKLSKMTHFIADLFFRKVVYLCGISRSV